MKERLRWMVDEIRDRKGLTLDELAQRCSIHRNSLTNAWNPNNAKLMVGKSLLEKLLTIGGFTRHEADTIRAEWMSFCFEKGFHVDAFRTVLQQLRARCESDEEFAAILAKAQREADDR